MNGILLQAVLSLMSTIAAIVIPILVVMYIGVLIWDAISKRMKK